MAAVVSSKLAIEAALIKAFLVTSTGSITPALSKIGEFICQAIVAKVAFAFVDLFGNQVALFAAVVGNGCCRGKGSLLDDRCADGFIAGQFQFIEALDSA